MLCIKWHATVSHHMELSSLNNLNSWALSLSHSVCACVCGNVSKSISLFHLFARSLGCLSFSHRMFSFLVFFLMFSIFSEINWPWQCWTHHMCVCVTNVKWMKSKCSLNGNAMSQHVKPSLFFLFFSDWMMLTCAFYAQFMTRTLPTWVILFPHRIYCAFYAQRDVSSKYIIVCVCVSQV